MDVSNDLQVRWKHHQLGVMEYLRQLLVSEVFVDVTLCCQNKRFRAHRVLLSACSSYLQKLLLEHGTSDHVTIILPDVDPEDMHWLLHFIYTGTVAVPRSRLGSFLQAADSLGVKMLADIQSQDKCDVDSVICCVDLKRDDFKLTKEKRTYTSENIRSQLLGNVFENKVETKDHISGQSTEPNTQKIDTKKEERRTRSLCDSSEPVKRNSAVELSGSLQKCESMKSMDIASKPPESAICFNPAYCVGRQKECCDARTDINPQTAPIKLMSPLQNNSMPCCPRNALDFTDPGTQRNDGNPEVKSSPINAQANGYSGMLPQCAVRPFVNDKCQQKQHRDEILTHSRNLYAEFHHSEHYSLQHLAQWAKPIPSLMPLANNNYNFNGKFPNVPPSPALLPGGERPLNGYVTRPNIGGDYGKDEAPLPPPPPPQLAADPRWLHQRLPGQMPRLSPIVPPSPWVQHHRPPCAAPRAYTNSLQHSGGATGGNPGHRIANTAPSGHALQQAFGDPTFHCAATAIHMNTAETTDAAEGHTTKLRRHEANEPDIRKRNLGSTETLLCRLKERRLQEFYREQNTEKARDLSTSSSTTALPATTQKMPAIPPGSFQQKLKHIAELSSPRLPDHRDKLLAVKKEEEDEGSDTRKFITDDVGSLKTEPNSMNDEENNDEDASNNSTKLTNGVTEVANNKRESEDDEVQILSASAVPPPAYTKNDNNNNGTVAKNHGCEDCGKSFSRRQLLVQHRRIHTGERPYSCADCGRQFTQRGHWSTHQKLHEPSRRPEHACPSCGKAFVTRASLKVHLRTHTGEKPFQCTECGKQFSQLRNYKYHRSVHEGTREFAATCPECGKYFNDRGYLSSHMKIHRNRKEYGCQYCGKSFNQRVAYNMHVRIHTGERPHSCPHCSKSFSRKMLLKQHLRIHTGEKPFACSVCGKAFADRSNMTLHMRLHSGVKPYSCSLCSKAFTKKHHLKTHLNYHTGTKPYSCSKCGLRFSQSSNMRTHYKKCTSTGPPQNSSPEHSVNENTLTANPSLKLNGGSPVVSPGTSSTVGSEVAVSSPRSASASVITPPHSDESSCGSSVISRNGMDVQMV